MASSEAVTQATAGTEPQPLQISVAVQSTITLSGINALVAHIAGLTGCTPCGLLGVDLRMFGVDSFEVGEIQSIQAVTGVAGVTVLQQ
jgi:hypothetical protein